MLGQEAWAEVAAARGPALLRFAVMLTGNSVDAEDLVQDTLAKAHRQGERIAAMDAPAAYLRTVMVREHISWGRRARRAPRTTAVLSEDDPRLADVAWREPGEQLALQDALWGALGSLPRRQQAVLALRYYEDLSDIEIAAVLGCSTGTVRSHASRALATLRTRIMEENQ